MTKNTNKTTTFTSDNNYIAIYCTHTEHYKQAIKATVHSASIRANKYSALSVKAIRELHGVF